MNQLHSVEAGQFDCLLKVADLQEVESLKTPDPILPFSVSASMGCGGGEPNNNNNRAANEAFDLESLLLPVSASS